MTGSTPRQRSFGKHSVALVSKASSRAPGTRHSRDPLYSDWRTISSPMPNFVTGLLCVFCHSQFSPRVGYTCPKCGITGILDVQYDYRAIRKALTRRKLAARTDHSHWRYRELLPIADRAPLASARSGMDTDRRGRPAGAPFGSSRTAHQGRRPQSHRLAERPRQFAGRGEGGGEAPQDHRLRQHRECRVVAGGHGGEHGIAQRDLRAAARARAQGHATADLRRHRAARRRQLRAGVRTVPAIVRALGLVQPQLRHQSLPGGRQEDGRAGNRGTARVESAGLDRHVGGRRLHHRRRMESVSRIENHRPDRAHAAHARRAGGGRGAGHRGVSQPQRR